MDLVARCAHVRWDMVMMWVVMVSIFMRSPIGGAICRVRMRDMCVVALIAWV